VVAAVAAGSARPDKPKRATANFCTFQKSLRSFGPQRLLRGGGVQAHPVLRRRRFSSRLVSGPMNPSWLVTALTLKKQQQNQPQGIRAYGSRARVVVV
jgi:hypothetical protein